MDLIVRAATPADLPAILAIYNHAVLHSTASADYDPNTLEMRQAWFAERTGNGFPIFVAQETTYKQATHGRQTAPSSQQANDAPMDVGRIVGWSAYGPYHSRIGYRYTVENSVYVAADCRGQGVGKQLLAPLIAHATKNGFPAMIAGIDGSNEASMRLHAAFGFTHVGRLAEVVYKFDRWLDVVYMQKLLLP